MMMTRRIESQMMIWNQLGDLEPVEDTDEGPGDGPGEDPEDDMKDDMEDDLESVEDVEIIEQPEPIEHGSEPPAKRQHLDQDDFRTLRCAGRTKKNRACREEEDASRPDHVKLRKALDGRG
jgi:hypothetical protein